MADRTSCSASAILWNAIFFITLSRVAMGCNNVLNRTMLLTHVPDQYRGRVFTTIDAMSNGTMMASLAVASVATLHYDPRNRSRGGVPERVDGVLLALGATRRVGLRSLIAKKQGEVRRPIPSSAHRNRRIIARSPLCGGSLGYSFLLVFASTAARSSKRSTRGIRQRFGNTPQSLISSRK